MFSLKLPKVQLSSLALALIGVGVASFPLTQEIQRWSSQPIKQLEQLMRLERARELMEKLKPTRVKLEPGKIARLDEDLLVEKKADGRIVIYEVVT